MAASIQQVLRRWVRDNRQAHGPLVLSEADRRELADGISRSLSILDQIWEMGSGRSLTDEEKFGPTGDTHA